MNITLRQLKVFEMVAKRLSFTRAAEELYLTQPAVSMQVRQFEDTVGLPLFERLGKKIFLTEAGREMYRLSKVMAEKVDDAEQVIDELKGAERGSLVVSVASTVHYFAIRLLADFSKHYPKVSLNLKVTNRKGVLEHLEQNETDIALMGIPPADQDLVAIEFMDNPLVIIAPPKHRLAMKKSISLKELKNETFLMREQDSGTRSSVERFLGEKQILLTPSMEMNNNEAIKMGVEMGLGLGIVSIHTVDQELKDGRIVILDADSFPIMRQWFIAYRTGKRLSVIARVFESFVKSEANRFVRIFDDDHEAS